MDQSLAHGGTFVFHGPRTLFAHYDPAWGVHASVDSVIEVAKKALDEGKQ